MIESFVAEEKKTYRGLLKFHASFQNLVFEENLSTEIAL